MAILQLIAEKEKSLCFDFLEEKIREESRKLIESIYADEVNQFLEKMASISNFNPQHLTISHSIIVPISIDVTTGDVITPSPILRNFGSYNQKLWIA